MAPFDSFFRDSLRRKIILAFVAGFFLLAAIFSLFMLVSERDGLYRDSHVTASGLASSFAVSSRSWVLSNDLVGMQEIVDSFQGYPGLRYAMILAPGGRVLAHTDETKVGQYLSDTKDLLALKTATDLMVLREDADAIDIAAPVTVGKRIVGWAWISLDRGEISHKLYMLGLKVAFFILVVTLLVLFAVTGLGNRLGRRIDALVSVADAVKTGHYDQRVHDPAGNADEIGGLAESLNLMLDALAQNEARLRSTSQYTRSLIEASLDPLVTISAQGKITDVNAATEQVTGRSRDELIGTDFSDYFTDPEQARAGYRQVFALGKVIDYPLAIRHRDGHVSEVLYNASIYHNEAGEVQGVFAAARDITEQQRTALLSAQLAAIVESSNEAIIGKTLDGTITSWNRGAEMLYGYRAEEVIGKRITLLAPLARHDEVYSLLLKAGSGDTISNHETERVRKDGALIHVSLTLSPIRDKTGRVRGISTIARDITEQKRMEQERAETLRYFESMDRIDRAMQQAKDLEGMLSDVLGEVLDIFGCDRVGLVYPCDPTSPTWQIVMERAKTGYSTEPLRGPLPMTEVRADSMRWLLEKSGPVQFTPEDDPDQLRRQNFGIRSFMSMAVRPRIGKAWEFGIHQCTHARSWSAQEAKLFEEIARRLADGLNSMLANRDLRESEQRYRLVFENSPVSIWEEDFSAVKTLLDGLRQQGVTDLDTWFTQHPETLAQCAQATKILDVNSAAIGLHGASSKEVLLAGLLDTFTPESFETFRRELVCLWNGDTQMSGDAVVKTLGGELRHVTIYFAVCPGYETTWGKLIVSLVDITERKQAEEQIRQNETKYRTLIQNIQAAVVVHAADTSILVANAQAQDILGLSAEQMQGKVSIDPDWHFFREDGKPATVEEYPVNRVLAEGKAVRNLVMGVHRPNRGGDVWVLVSADPVLREDGSTAQVIVTFIDITERKQSELRLRESEQAFRALAENSPDVIVRYDRQGRRIYVNPEFERVNHLTAQQVLGKTPHELSTELKPKADVFTAKLMAVIESGAPDKIDFAWETDGKQVCWFVRLVPEFDANGKVVSILTIWSDISERKQAEENLKRMNERFALATRAAEVGVWDWDIPKNELLWDDSMYRLYGIKEGDFGGAYDAWASTIHPQDKAYTEGEIQAALRGEREYAPEFRIVRPDGSIRHIKADSQTFRDKDGKPLRMIGTNIDITERVRMEKVLEASEQEFRSLAESSPDFIIRYDLQHRMRYLNSALANFLGLASTDVVIGKRPIEVWPDGRFAIIDEVAARVIETGNAETIESMIPTVSGEYRFHQIQVVAERDVAGQIIGTIALGRDITERKRAEEELLASERRYRMAQGIARVGNWEYDLQTQRFWGSDEAKRIYGFDPAQPGFTTDEVERCIPERERVHQALIDLIEKGKPYNLEFEIIPRGSSAPKIIASIADLQRDEQGKPLVVMGVIQDITERKQAEEALRREQALLNRVMETSPVGIAVVSREGQITFANPQAERILGLSKEQMTQRTYNAPEWHSTAIDGGPFPDEAQPFSRVMATRQPVFDVQHAVAWPDGRRVLLSINGAPLFDAKGEIEGVAFSIEDITQRKQADETLRRNERSLVEAQRIAHLGNWELDLVNNELKWSDEIYRIFEIDPQRFGASYEAFLNAIHPDDRELVNRAYTDSVRERMPYDIVHRLRMADGRIKYVNEKCETRYDAGGKPLLSIGTVHDITERKLAEQALLEKMRHSQSLLRLSRRLEQAQSNQEILDAARDEVRSTLGYQSLWAYLFSEDRKTARALVAGGPLADIVMSEQGTATLTIEGDPMLEAIATAQEIVLVEDAQTEERVNKEIVTALKMHTIVNVPIILFNRHLGCVGTGTFGDEGVRVPTEMEREYLMALASHMAAALDRIYLLSERRKAEQEVQELNRDLEQRVVERTEQLEAANKELESFSYSVSHDLRSPLRAIDGFSHILLEDYNEKLDEDGKRMLGIVRNNTQRMGQLIDDILKFSRSGRSEINAVEVDMAALAHEVLDELQIGIDKVANLHCEIGELPPARCDRAMMRQVFANLLSNAIKFSRMRESPQIEVGAEVRADETVYHVKDNGVGFDMHYADKLFGMFQRLHSMEEFEGTGIGLAIVKRIVTRHGGRVWAEGKVDAGATLYFSLPHPALKEAEQDNPVVQ